MNEQRRWLVTGGSGFIGTNLIESLLAKGEQVTNLDIAPPRIEAHRDHWHPCDILDAEKLTKTMHSIAPTLVIHLAARTDLDHDATVGDYAANSRGVENLVAAINDTSSATRLLVASTMLVCRLGYAPSSDTDYCPTTAYGQSKVETETIVRRSMHSCIWTIVRPTTIWGPWHTRLRSEFLERVKRGHYVHPTGKHCERSYGYVGNVVHQLIALAEAETALVEGRTLYVGDPPIRLEDYVDGFHQRLRGKRAPRIPYSILRLAALAGDVLSRLGVKRVPLTSYRLSNMTTSHRLELGPTLAITGENPFDLTAGIAATCRWMEMHPTKPHMG